MSEPALYVVVRSDQAVFYLDKWGSESAAELLLSGPAAEQHMITRTRIAPVGLEELPVESAFMIDFDRQAALATPGDQTAAGSELVKQAQARWPGDWSLGFAEVSDFLEYLDAYQVELLGPTA